MVKSHTVIFDEENTAEGHYEPQAIIRLTKTYNKDYRQDADEGSVS